MARLNYNGNNSQVNSTYAEMKVLERAGPHLALELACDKKPVPKNTNENITFSRAVNPAVNTNTVTEGVTPASRAIEYERVAVSLGEYVEIFEVSSRSKELGQLDVIRDSKDVLRDLILNTREAVSWNVFRAGTSVLYDTSAHSARSQVDSKITLGRVQKATRLLRDNKAELFTEVDRGGMRQSTVTVEGAFLAYGHTNLEPDLRTITGFNTCDRYGGAKEVSKHEFGAVNKTRFITTPQLDAFSGAGAATSTMIATSGNADVYPVLIVGKHAWGCVGLRGAGKYNLGALHIEVLDGADKSDPANQRTYIATRWYDAKVILNDSWVRRLEVAATDNP